MSIQEILKFIRDNSTALKDVCTLIFTAVATVLAMLTYKRAKATILQPKRSELIKKQTETFSSFLSCVNDNDGSIDSALDYDNLLNYNVDLVLREFGLIEINQDSEKYLEYRYNIAGWVQFLENDIHDYILAMGDIVVYDKSIFDVNGRARQKYYNNRLSEKVYTVNRIFFTKKHFTFYKKIREFANNPFLPSDLQKLAFKIVADMENNIHKILRSLLSKLVELYYQQSITPTEDLKYVLLYEYRHQELFRIYATGRNQHEEDYKRLKDLIRKHLNIDEKW